MALLRVMQKTLMCIYVKKFVLCSEKEHTSLGDICISTLVEQACPLLSEGFS
jgi:hypothetical protein